jgi:hypothetical protein
MKGRDPEGREEGKGRRRREYVVVAEGWNWDQEWEGGPERSLGGLGSTVTFLT